jgi:hypothetical protein
MGLEKLISATAIFVVLAASTGQLPNSKAHHCRSEGTNPTHPRHEGINMGNADAPQRSFSIIQIRINYRERMAGLTPINELIRRFFDN